MSAPAMPKVEILSETDIEARLRRLSDRVGGLSLYEMRDRAHRYELTLEQLEILRELERLEFLLSD